MLATIHPNTNTSSHPLVNFWISTYDFKHACTSSCRLERDDLSDDEVLESGEEGSDDEGESRAVKNTISATRAATVGGVTSRMRARAKTIDSTLKPMSRLHLYDYQTWRMEVSSK